MNRGPPDVWAAFLLHQAEGGLHGKLLLSGDGAQNPCRRHFECNGDVTPTSQTMNEALSGEG